MTGAGASSRLALVDTSAWIACARFGDPVAIYTRDRVLAREAIRLGVGWE